MIRRSEEKTGLHLLKSQTRRENANQFTILKRLKVARKHLNRERRVSEGCSLSLSSGRAVALTYVCRRNWQSYSKQLD